jgi:hypothetical protein
MTPAQTEEATALAEILCEIFLRAPKPAPDAEFDEITDNTLTKRIRLLQ